jgi:pyruvate/2-oxoglutarate dehydrogenase complex dihydrolipoamide dehydrogenase (E3) component
MRTDFDFIVVGGGSAGYAAARTAAGLGLQTAVVEGGDEVGGLCILRGCMPSKTLLASANAYRTLRRAKEFGLHANGIGFDANAIRLRKEKLIAEFAEFRQMQLQDGRFSFFRGRASFSGARSLHVLLKDGGAVELRGRAFLISTGSVINTPEVPGLDAPEILTSDTLLATAEVPASVVVLGAGPVALEAAHYYESLGSVVTIVQRSTHFLSGTDSDVADAVEHAFRARGMQVFTGTKLHSVERDGRLLIVRFEHGGAEKSVAAEAVLNALGRRPAVDGLDVGSAGIELAGRAVRVLPTQQTTAPHIFAAGDVCGPYEIVHIAIQQGEIAARNAARLLSGEGEPLETTDYRLRVFAAFTEPQLAVAGYQEAELKSAGRPYFSASHAFADHGKSMVMGETEGFVKMLADSRTGELLGASVVGPEASDLIHETVVALNFRATVHEFAKIPHYHPTLSEIWTYPAEELAEKCGTASITRS